MSDTAKSLLLSTADDLDRQAANLQAQEARKLDDIAKLRGEIRDYLDQALDLRRAARLLDSQIIKVNEKGEVELLDVPEPYNPGMMIRV